jgi:chromosome segregation ATPase
MNSEDQFCQSIPCNLRCAEARIAELEQTVTMLREYETHAQISTKLIPEQAERIAELEHALSDKAKYVVRLEGLRETDRERIAELEAERHSAHFGRGSFTLRSRCIDAEKRIKELEGQVTAAGDGDTWREACKRCEREIAALEADLARRDATIREMASGNDVEVEQLCKADTIIDALTELVMKLERQLEDAKGYKV